MNGYDEIRHILLEILRAGLLRIRACGNSGLAEMCSVEDERSVSVPDKLSLTFTGASRINVPVMSDGAFHTSLSKGQYRIGLDGLPRGFTLKSISEDSTDLRREALKLSGPQTLILVVLEAR
jgi:hypothetical protein